ncbi:MAG: glycosyltransferase family 39 protein [Bryobacterales bacterium]|nr:glycosyltransferase family 39 protein [Bryobacterales bacterium]
MLALRDPFQVHRPETNPDGVLYHRMAVHLLRGHGYESVITEGQPTRYWMPGFPLLLAGTYYVAGERPVVVYFSLCLLGAVTCLVTYFLGRELRGEAFGRTSGVLCAIYFPHIYLASLFLSENLYALLVGAAAFFAVRYLKQRRGRDLAASALTTGLGILTRPFLLLGAILFAGWLLLRAKGAGLARWAAPAYLLAVLAVLSPWVVRNYLLDGRLVILTTGKGATFYGANNDRVLRDVRAWGTWLEIWDPVIGIEDEWLRDRVWWEHGLRWARENWQWFLVLTLARTVRFWLPEFGSPNRAFVLSQLVTYTPFLVLFIAGLSGLRRQAQRERDRWAPIHAFVLASVVAGAIFWAAARFRDGNAPLLMVYAAMGAEHMMHCVRKQTNTMARSAQAI